MINQYGPSNFRGFHVHVERRWFDQSVAIWFLTRDHVAHLDPESNVPHGLVWNKYREGSPLPDPTMVIPEDIYRALIEAGTDYLPPSAATDRHLEDSVKVRDRLLTLVEKQNA